MSHWAEKDSPSTSSGTEKVCLHGERSVYTASRVFLCHVQHTLKKERRQESRKVQSVERKEWKKALRGLRVCHEPRRQKETWCYPVLTSDTDRSVYSWGEAPGVYVSSHVLRESPRASGLELKAGTASGLQRRCCCWRARPGPCLRSDAAHSGMDSHINH